jgi:hypothetical protein
MHSLILFCNRRIFALLAWLPLLFSSAINAQIIYGSGDSTGGTNRTQLFAITPASGVVTRVCSTATFLFTTTAIGVLNTRGGEVVYIERVNAANPRIGTFDPITCTNAPVLNTTLPANIVRATT